MSRRVALIDEYGIRRLVKNPVLEDELAVLDGHTVVVDGYVSGGPKRGYTIHARAYELRAEEEMRVFKGVVKAREEGIAVRSTGNGARCYVKGELAEALREFDKCLVWVWGEELQAGGGGEELFGLDLKGYAVLGYGE